MIEQLALRNNNKCELCQASTSLLAFQPPPKVENELNYWAAICEKCKRQITEEEELEVNHWRCLNDSIWSEVSAVKVISWRLLNRLKSEGWPLDLLNMMYLTEEELAWAKEGQQNEESEDQLIHKDSNGAILSSGDSVVLIKDLNVKGANFTAKRGTAVRNISLVHDQVDQIEGRVNGQQIVILTQFVKKS